MNLRFYFLFFALYLSFSSLFAQNFILENAVSLYNNGEFDAAKNQIERAAMHPRFKLFPKTWYYYFSIHKELKNYDKLRYATLQMMELSKNDTYYIKFKDYLKTEVEVFINEPDNVIYNITDYFYLLTVFEFLEDIESTEEFNKIIADYYYNEGMYDSSLHYYSKKATTKKIQFNNYIGQLNTLSIQRNFDLYNKVMIEARTNFPNDTRFTYFEIDRLISKKLYFKAKSEIESLFLVDSTSAQLYVKYGKVNQLLNRKEESLKAYKKAYKIDSNSFAANFGLGMIYKEQVTRSSSDSTVNNARKYLEKAEQLAPKSLDVLKPLEEFYLDIRDIPNYTRVRKSINGL